MLLNIRELEKKYDNSMVDKILANFDYVPTWQPLIHSVDNLLRLHYGNRELLEYYKSVDEQEVQADFEVLLYAYLKSKEIEYKKLYEISIANYNPLENYRMEEREELTDTKDNMYGVQSTEESTNIDEMQVNEEYTKGSEKSDSSTEYDETNVNGTTTNKRAPFDSESYANDREITDNTTTEARTDKTTVNTGERTDNRATTTNEHGMTHNINISEHSDTLHTDMERSLTRSGNIGVTTSQQMAESEILLAVKLNIAERISRDIANIVSKGVYVAL